MSHSGDEGSRPQTGQPLSTEELDELVASSDTGGRQPSNAAVGQTIVIVAAAWSVFQLWIASPLPFITGFAILSDSQARPIHLAFATFLAFLAFPAFAKSPRDRVPVTDWVLAAAAVFCLGYRFWFYRELADRPGLPTTLDIVASVVGILVLLEATRRTLGPPLVIVAAVFLTYVFFGDAAWVPDAIRWAGASLNKAMGHMMLTEEGVFGIALGVSTKFVFLFVLFGSLLDKAGAGNYFIQVAFSLLGHLRGGPAKAAVVASGMTGLISGSSIANVVTTGTFTVPLMKRVGFSSEKAGAVEVASSVNGQIMPPVMGAAAFLMVEYIGIPYTDVIRHAFLPAVISYIALIYIVHLEAMKAGMQGLEKRPDPRSTSQRLLAWGIIVCSILIVAGGTYFIVETLKPILGAIGPWFFGSVLMAVYVGLVWFGAQYPELGMDDPNSEIVTLPEVGPTVKSGLHFILPILVLVWCLMIERLSPALSAFWAAAFMIVIILTQRPLFALFRGRGALGGAGMRGLEDLFNGLVTGARNMIGIGIATATAGIIVGTVTLTGVGLVLANFVEILSGGHVLIMLILVAVLSLILGMGLPTTANYIVVSSLMAPVVVALGAKSGLIVPLIAVHLFVFYFGIMADVTPPVGLASFAAAAVSGGDPIKTGFTAFFYSMRTAALPFIFIFNTELLLIGITGPIDLVITVVTATIAMLVFAAATQGFFVTRSRIWESLVLLLISFTLFRPGFWMDMVVPPFQEAPGGQVLEVIANKPAGSDVRMVVNGINIDGDEVTKTVVLPLADEGTPDERLEPAGLTLRTEGDQAFVDTIAFDGQAADAGVDFDFEILTVQAPGNQPPKDLFLIPALALLAGIWWLQRGRRARAEA